MGVEKETMAIMCGFLETLLIIIYLLERGDSKNPGDLFNIR
jgi:hypothetical protein